MNLRKHGKSPYKVAVIHGGPGGAGGVRALAEELSHDYGVLEPLQTAMSVKGQIEELKTVLEENVEGPATLIGHSWGAWLVYMLAAEYPELVEKIILVSSGPFDEKYFAGLSKNREERLTEQERIELSELRKAFSNPEATENINEVFGKFGKLMGKLDAYAPIETETDINECSYEIYSRVWPEAHNMRKTGELYEMGKRIKCEVVAIHGDFDSHPLEGVREPLAEMIDDFKFYELKRCGHSPWEEEYARDEFFRILREEIVR